MTVSKRPAEPPLPPDEELAELFAAMRREAPPHDLEQKLLGAVAVAGAVTVVKSGFLSGLLARVASLGAAGTAWKTGASIGLVAGGVGVAAALGPWSGFEPLAPSTPGKPPPLRSAPALSVSSPQAVSAPVSSDAPLAPADATRSDVASAREPEPVVPRRPPAARSPESTAPSAPAPSITPPDGTAAAAPLAPADVLREEASRVRGIAAEVAGGRCGGARALARAYWAAFPAGQLGYEVRVLEARCPPDQ